MLGSNITNQNMSILGGKISINGCLSFTVMSEFREPDFVNIQIFPGDELSESVYIRPLGQRK